MYKKLLVAIFVIIAASLQHGLSAQQLNSLTAKEKQEGWHLLFDGKDLQGWHSYLQKTPGKSWQVKEGNIVLVKNKQSTEKDFGDLVTNDEYENFDFKVDWKMTPCGNSGVMFYVHEAPEFKNTYESGPEMQIADLACNDDGRILKCRAGDIYDLVSADTEWVNPGGQWNHYEIRSLNGQVELFQNGHRISQTTFWDDNWRAMIKNTKFNDWPGFGTFKTGHISFQGTENGTLWFRNIKIRKL
jgi:Domain of Unknown Function (DUF1080)